MKTTEMSSTLKAFAALASAGRADELVKLASTFDAGTDETVAARVKRIVRGLRTQTGRLRYPPGVKESLTRIAAGFSASKAKQASDFQALVSLFEGAEAGASIDDFVTAINKAVVDSQTRSTVRSSQPQAPNERLASELADELTRTVLDPVAFSRVMDKLRNAEIVSTATLGVIANRFLRNSKPYSGRKSAMAEITERQEQDARNHARTKGLEHIPV